MSVADEVLRHVDADAAVELAREALRIQSLSGEEREVAQFFVRADEAGRHARRAAAGAGLAADGPELQCDRAHERPRRRAKPHVQRTPGPQPGVRRLDQGPVRRRGRERLAVRLRAHEGSRCRLCGRRGRGKKGGSRPQGRCGSEPGMRRAARRSGHPACAEAGSAHRLFRPGRADRAGGGVQSHGFDRAQHPGVGTHEAFRHRGDARRTRRQRGREDGQGDQRAWPQPYSDPTARRRRVAELCAGGGLRGTPADQHRADPRRHRPRVQRDPAGAAAGFLQPDARLPHRSGDDQGKHPRRSRPPAGRIGAQRSRLSLRDRVSSRYFPPARSTRRENRRSRTRWYRRTRASTAPRRPNRKC